MEKLELEPGGELVHTMPASGPEQIEFIRSAGLPLTSTSRKRCTEVERPRRLAYMSLVDFVPDTPPYEFLTVVELEPANGDVQVSMAVDSMHDQVWTERLVTGRANELDDLATLIESRR
ncbi:MAG: SRPBCC domain-containing protein [Gaiellaceae bacterium]